jgi:hypothetical protein
MARRNDLFPAATAVFVLHGPATAQHCRFMKRIVGEGPVLFFGDLDPMDLTTFGTLRAGGTGWDDDPAVKINVQYRGINDYVLCLAEENWAQHAATSPRPPGHAVPGLGPLLIRMQPIERRHLKVLCRLMPDLQRLVGPRAFDLMTGGWKLEVEALSFNRIFMAKLIHRVLDLGWHAPDGKRKLKFAANRTCAPKRDSE